jgi:hypothetical protein
MALTTEARELLITAFTGLGYRIYDTVPATPVTPSVVVIPDSPWIVPSRLGSTLNYQCRWRALLTINARVNDTATTQTETALDVLLAAVPSTFQVESVNAPQLLSLGAQGTVISTEINLSITMKE